MKIQIIVAAHKAYRMPTDPMYLPLHVGKAGKDLELGFQGDNTGENISEKNATYCELTGLYWAWKNLNADYIGLAHYRRHFRGKSGKDKWDCILTTAQAEQLLQNYDVLELMISLVSAQGENYRAAAEALRHRTWTHIYNMFIMKRDIFDGYCQWMFDILGQVEAQIDISGYSAYDRRVFGFLAERMLDIYLEANKIPYREVPVMFMESQNWLKKGGAFLKRKFTSGKEG